MSTDIEELEDRIRHLSVTDLAAFRRWFAEFDAEAWDRQLEPDAEAGRLDALADEALEDHAAGGSSEL
jgi:hypothetical protein